MLRDPPETLLIYRACLEDVRLRIVARDRATEALERVFWKVVRRFIRSRQLPRHRRLEDSTLIVGTDNGRHTRLFHNVYADEMQGRRAVLSPWCGWTTFLSPIVARCSGTKVQVFVICTNAHAAVGLQPGAGRRGSRSVCGDRAAQPAGRTSSWRRGGLSHERRTPMNVSLGGHDAADAAAGRADQRTRVETIRAQWRAQKRDRDFSTFHVIVTAKCARDHAVDPRRVSRGGAGNDGDGGAGPSRLRCPACGYRRGNGCAAICTFAAMSAT